MNIELKPIAESKVRQLGGDVCGVLVRTEDGVMAVSEHGRCTRLDAGVMGPVEPAGMNERELFEQRFPVPAGIYWNDISEQYDALPGAAGFDDVEIYHGQWMGWQAARAQGGQAADVAACPLCEYERGHQIGCENNPVDMALRSSAQPVAEIVHDYNGISVQWLEPAKYGRFQSGQKLYTQPQPAVPEEYRQALQDAYDIIVCDANSPKNYGSLCRIGHVLGQITTPTTPQADGWVRCEDRLPTYRDSDEYGDVWAMSKLYGVKKMSWSSVRADFESHWMPTGLKRPQPPKEGEGDE
ncbi:hypothetical protein [Marinobacter nauticus]|uniref:DUF551 domain-containing protein n=1 Tax=Marinobacter nauticus TaxID=2743 RepID=A0A833JRU3_MARNT|nr:hypothetical protein [Marinobacter nauticus]KAE8545396.1 hypothetical protein F6453_2368 [Marinobacter nauticus]